MILDAAELEKSGVVADWNVSRADEIRLQRQGGQAEWALAEKDEFMEAERE